MGKQQKTGECIASNTRLAGCASGLFSTIQQGHPCCQVLLGMEEARAWGSTGDLAVRVSLNFYQPSRKAFKSSPFKRWSCAGENPSHGPCGWPTSPSHNVWASWACDLEAFVCFPLGKLLSNLFFSNIDLVSFARLNYFLCLRICTTFRDCKYELSTVLAPRSLWSSPKIRRSSDNLHERASNKIKCGCKRKER